MKTLKNIVTATYYICLFFALILGGMMHYFGNTYGKYILLFSVLFAMYDMYKNDKE